MWFLFFSKNKEKNTHIKTKHYGSNYKHYVAMGNYVNEIFKEWLCVYLVSLYCYWLLTLAMKCKINFEKYEVVIRNIRLQCDYKVISFKITSKYVKVRQNMKKHTTSTWRVILTRHNVATEKSIFYTLFKLFNRANS